MPFPKKKFLDTKSPNPGTLLSTDLLSTLRIDILARKYAQGQKLTEQHICSDYNVSRTPVREAFRQLETEGLIETIPNRGAFVIGFSDRDFRDLFDLRKSYEMQAVKWAIERITKDEIDALEETFEFMEFYTQKNDVEKISNINMNFHQLIYMATRNKMLHTILSTCQLYMRHTKKQNGFGDDYLSVLLEEHREIFNAFKSKDAGCGITAMEKHMDNLAGRNFQLQRR